MEVTGDSDKQSFEGEGEVTVGEIKERMKRGMGVKESFNGSFCKE